MVEGAPFEKVCFVVVEGASFQPHSHTKMRSLSYKIAKFLGHKGSKMSVTIDFQEGSFECFGAFLSKKFYKKK